MSYRLLITLLLIAGAALPCRAQEAAISPAERVKLGKQYYKEGRYRDAARQFNRALSERGATLPAANRAKLERVIAQSLYKAGDATNARTYIEKARRDAPADAAVLKLAALITAPQAPVTPTISNVPVSPVSTPSPAAPAGNGLPAGFVRVTELEGGKHALQTGRAVMVSPDGKAKVILDGMCHLGEKSYYQNVQASLVPLDVVLYEAVVVNPEDTKQLGRVNPGDPGQAMAAALGLAAQTLTIDYRRPNFLWADITLPELIQYEKSPGFVAAVTGTKAEKNTPSNDDLKESDLREITSPRRAPAGGPPTKRQLELRAKMAQAFQASGGDLSAMGAPRATAELLIFRRNDYVMRALTDEIEKRGGGTFSILYGAGHMPDIARRLDCMGYKLEKLEWRDVWTY